MASIIVAAILIVVVVAALADVVLDWRESVKTRRRWAAQSRDWADQDAAGSCYRRNER